MQCLEVKLNSESVDVAVSQADKGREGGRVGGGNRSKSVQCVTCSLNVDAAPISTTLPSLTVS
jgi:hypothetical protein